MTRVQQRASLHETAVQKVARDEVAARPRKSRKAREKAPVVRHIKVDPAVWKAAQDLLASPKNAYSTLEVVGPHEVVVR